MDKSDFNGIVFSEHSKVDKSAVKTNLIYAKCNLNSWKRRILKTVYIFTVEVDTNVCFYF